jgi:DNA polymerase epsilon subunit 2
MAQKQLGQLFRLHGLSLRPDALKLIVQAASSHPQPLELAKHIIEHVRAEQATDRVVDVRRVNAALGALSGSSQGRPAAGQVIEVIDAFDMPRVQYDSTHRAYSAAAVPRALHASAAAQRDVYASRLALIRQRILRNKIFKRPALERRSGPAGLSLSDVEALQPNSGQQCVLGLLCEPSEGEYHLEDLTGFVPVDLSRARPLEGLFTLGCIVLVEGELTAEGIFEVSMLSHPFPEEREATRAVLDGMCAFGPSISSNSDKAREALLEVADGAMMVVLSDVWLDSDDALVTLERILDGYEGLAASSDTLGADLCFVLCGNFTAEPLACSDFYTMRGYFEQLGELIRARPTLAAHAHFVLVPGPHDLTLGATEALPRSKLPKLFAQGVSERVAHVHLASNPVRLRFFGREVVLFRDELVIHLRRSAIVEPKTDVLTEMAEHVRAQASKQPQPRPPLLSLATRGRDALAHARHASRPSRLRPRAAPAPRTRRW